MNEQTKNELKVRLEELQKQSDDAWKEYQKAEKELIKLQKISQLTAEEQRVADLKSTWHKFYVARDGIRAILALEVE